MPPAMPAPLVLLTRPRAASQATADRLRCAGVAADRILVAPLMETEPVGASWSPDAWTGLVFTSAEGVRHAVMGHDLRSRMAWCVGDRTAEAAAAAGMEATSAGGTVEELAALIARRRPPGPLLHLCGADTRGDLAGRMTRAGTETVALVLYRQVPVLLDPAVAVQLGGPARIVAPAYSPLSAQRLSEALATWAPRIHLVAISPATATAWEAPPPSRTTIASAPDGAAMEQALLAALRVEAGGTDG